MTVERDEARARGTAAGTVRSCSDARERRLRFESSSRRADPHGDYILSARSGLARIVADLLGTAT
jgi:hypothetical protein